MPALRHAHAIRGAKALWFGSFAVLAACSGSDKIDFFSPSDDDGAGGTTGGTGAQVGGTDSGGSSTGGATVSGGTAGDSSGGTGAGANGGSSGDTGGTDSEGGTNAGAGMGGTPTAGGASGKGGDAGSGTSGDAGIGGGGMGGTGGAGMGGAGAGAGGAGMGGAGMGGAGMGGAGIGGVGGAAGVAGAAGCTPTSPSAERCDGVDNNCAGGIDEGSTCPDNCTGATRAGHYYIFCSFEDASGTNRLRSWTQAQDFCTTRSTSLLFIESAEENAFVLAWITRLGLADQVWMGANDRDPTLGLSNEGEWVWGLGNNAVQFWNGDENGMAVMNRYEDWANGEPNNQGNEDCGVLSAEHSYHWDDRVCTNMYPNFVCESGVAITPN